MKEQFDLDTELVDGGGGVFEVALDGHTVFSKKQLGRFPNNGEVEHAVSELL